MNRSRLSDEEVEQALSSLPEWRVVDGYLRRRFEFPSFVVAFGFMTRVAMAAERMDHHPDWSNVYSTVTINLQTHDAGGLTALDFELARQIDALL